MAFITPKTWAVGEVLSAVDLNVFLRDNTNALNEGFRFINRRIFNTPGTFTFEKSNPVGDGSVDGAIIRAYRIICLGGGGGGGGGGTVATGTPNASPASGGSSGAYAERFALSAAYGATVEVVVGAAGVGGTGANGGDGGLSSFAGTNTRAGGGRGGVFRASTATPCGSTSTFTSTVFNGDIAHGGQPGESGFVLEFALANGGNGGSSLFGGGGAGLSRTTAAVLSDATGHGAGGGGRMVASPAGPTKGGDGSPGLVIVELFA